MSEKLDLILEKLSLLESKVNENIEITKALRDRQEETDAKLEALSMDVHKMHGDLARLEEKVDSNHQETIDELQNLKLDLDFTYQKTTLNERELFKLKSKQ